MSPTWRQKRPLQPLLRRARSAAATQRRIRAGAEGPEGGPAGAAVARRARPGEGPGGGDGVIRLRPGPKALLFRRSIPRRAFVAAALGALYAFLLFPTPDPMFPGLGVNLAAVAWLLMGIGLLFLQPIAYHAYMTWSLVWVVWRSVVAYREGSWVYVFDVVIPTVSLVLLLTSSYLADARAAKAADEAARSEEGAA